MSAMAGERTYPVLPCSELEETLGFYQALGFTVTFRQPRPSPYAVVERGEIGIHLAAITGFDPASSYGSAIITVPDPGQLWESFRDGLRSRFGAVPTRGIPRLLRPRRKAGTATGFTVVDPGGNWLRFYRSGVAGDESPRTGLGRAIDVAARQGDAHGDEAQAIAILDAGLLRHPDAPPAEIFEALLYRAELKGRIGQNPEGDLTAAELLLATQELGAAAARALDEISDAFDR
ncbi:MAG TPA: VOC family protein [Propionicimonas sp.]|uniref:bleomycin resistance protein n=1 Tax=Propionicimonas sp. TaxID=1955623 RepID=UPI002F3E91AB